MPNLDKALRAASPRLSPVPTPWPSLLIHGGVALLWLALFARAFVVDGLFAWSTGLVYIGYDTLLLVFVFIQTLALLRPAAPPADAVRVSLGVIIAAHNEAAVLPTTLTAMAAQADPAELVVVADDGSTDGTAALLTAQYGLTPPPLGGLSEASPVYPALRWLRLPHGGKARALNAAMVGIDTEMVLTVDADTHLEPGALAAMRAAFTADPALVAATGVLTPVCGPSVSGRLFELFQTYEYIRNFLSRYAWMRLDSLLLISGAFAGFRRAAVVAVGGFDTECLVEDYELIHRLRRHATLNGLGWTTAVLGQARARTEAPGTVTAFLRQRRRWFGGFLQTQLWYRAMVGDRRYGWLGLAMLPVKAVDTLQPLYGLTAITLLLAYLVHGRFALAVPVFGVIFAKIVIDFAFHLWSVVLYRRWVDADSRARLWVAVLASLVEPFTFQVLRHLGASWGWVVFLTGARSWGVQRRVGFAVSEAAPTDR
jgi:cellulose synthase/poly-beta-1,6-N-acetylglucosamine synthase-like glycosyltransferase